MSEKSKRSQRSPQTGYPNVQESSKSVSSSISSVSKKQMSGEEKSHEKGIHSSKKTSTTVQEEKSMSKQLSQNTRSVSGQLEDVAPIVKTEKIKYSPSAQQSPLTTKSVPVIATETRKVAYTETRVMKFFLCHFSNLWEFNILFNSLADGKTFSRFTNFTDKCNEFECSHSAATATIRKRE